MLNSIFDHMASTLKDFVLGLLVSHPVLNSCELTQAIFQHPNAIEDISPVFFNEKDAAELYDKHKVEIELVSKDLLGDYGTLDEPQKARLVKQYAVLVVMDHYNFDGTRKHSK